MAGKGLLQLNHLSGLFLMLSAAVVYTMHLTGVRKWGFSWKDVLVTVSTVNVILFTPLWFLLPSSIAKASLSEIAVQSVYQGIIVNIIALMCVAYSVKNLGMVTTSMFMSFVPVSTALLAWVCLGEALVARELIGIAGCSLGLLLYTRGTQ
jgi:drug/metabolite transporter (DMT)-like permease